jgi:hypothetical protein
MFFKIQNLILVLFFIFQFSSSVDFGFLVGGSIFSALTAFFFLRDLGSNLGIGGYYEELYLLASLSLS